MKKQYRGGLPKKGELGQFADLRGAWQERGGSIFERVGLIPCAHCVTENCF